MSDVVDRRNIEHGLEIPSETYSDQPYIVRTDDGAWLCVLTTGAGREGEVGQHVVTMRSTDRGASWSRPVQLEPGDSRENSYAVLLKVPSGRVFCFYNHNTDNLRAVRADDPPYEAGLCRRVDSLGHFVFKHSDDHGRTWCERRTAIPVREMAIDRENAYGGAVRFFWNVGKPFMLDGAAYVSLHKVGGFGPGYFTRSEGVLLRSADLARLSDPPAARWETLPEGDAGIRAPDGGGPIAEEHSYSVLSDGSLYVVFRTVDGHPACSYSRDAGRTWSPPEYQRYVDGRLMKHPRAATFAWRCENGKYLYWFHNHGGRFVRESHDPMMPYADRNPVWLCGGSEAPSPDGRVIRWSQPEIVLYDDDPFVRISYPDLVQEAERVFLTETQKEVARVHPIDSALLEGLWDEGACSTVATRGLLLDLPGRDGCLTPEIEMPLLPTFVERDSGRADYGTHDLRTGFSLDVWVRLEQPAAGQILLDSRLANGQGLCLQVNDQRGLEIVLNDGRTENRWNSDPHMLAAGQRQHAVALVDAGPKIISFVVDGQLCDGRDAHQFGWGRFSPHLRHANGARQARLAQSPVCRIDSLRIYGRCLRTFEAVGNYKAGTEAGCRRRS